MVWSVLMVLAALSVWPWYAWSTRGLAKFRSVRQVLFCIFLLYGVTLVAFVFVFNWWLLVILGPICAFMFLSSGVAAVMGEVIVSRRSEEDDRDLGA